MSYIDKSPEVKELSGKVEQGLKDVFAQIDSVAESCTINVMSAFHEFRVSEACFAGTTGYGYKDLGRDTLAPLHSPPGSVHTRNRERLSPGRRLRCEPAKAN